MIHTGLITFHFAHHYGAQLQAYATMRAVQELGHGCEIIDYRLPHTTRTNQLYKQGGGVRGLASNAHTTLHYPAFKARHDRFEAFVAEQMKLSPRRYTSYEELCADPPAYDVYLAGSDQIWNPYIFQDKQFDRAFLLSFVKEGRRASYAPSLAVSSLPEELGAQLRGLLEPFCALSVREKKGQALLRSLGLEARVVLDPTLLLTGEQWGELAVAPRRREPYILCYFVSDPGEVAPYAQALSERTGCPIVQLAGARRKIPGARELVFDAGPREFLGLFRDAAYVCTNSFHGAVFSLQFGKPFFTSMSPKERGEPTFSRIYSLLSRLGCAERIVGLDATAPVDGEMDYAAVHARLEEARADSLAYLKAALEGAPLPREPAAPEPPRRPALCRAERCTGCTACAAVCPVGAIEMKEDSEGFLRPVIGDTCILCRKCEGACPGLLPARPPVGEPQARAVWNSDEGVRRESTSGGVFSVLADWALEAGGVVFGAAYGGDLSVRHVGVESRRELARLRQTKYVQSDLTGVFPQVKQALDNGRRVVFSGTPCQVDGLLRFLGGGRENLVTCDLVCHGVPSPGVYREWLAAEEARRGAKAASLLFRDKTGGWGAGKAVLTLKFKEGAPYSAPLSETTYGRGFGAAAFLRPCCHQCPYAGGARPGDFTLGDFWGLAPDALPVDAAGGVSLLLVNSAQGERLWPEISRRVGSVPRPWAEAAAGNPRLLSPTPKNPKRAVFFAQRAARGYGAAERACLSLPPLPYRAAAKVLTPGMKARIRTILK